MDQRKADISSLPFVGGAPLDASGKALLAGNVLAIVLAVVFQYSFLVVIWSYWIESVIIGIFTFLGLVLTGMRARNIGGLKPAMSFAGFFLFHYGFFHFVYLIFLVLMFFSALNPADYIYVRLTTGILFLSHGFSFVYNVIWRKEGALQEEDTADPKRMNMKLGHQMSAPYPRIIPIHVTIVLSVFVMTFAAVAGLVANTLLLILFMGLKTVGDLWAHNIRHRIS